MSAHPTLSMGEARQLVEYIYSIGGATAKVPSLPISGSLNPTMGNELKDNGVLYLLASYTDKGGPGIKPITGTATMELHNPKLPASGYTKADGVAVFEANGMKFLIPATAEGWVAYKKLDLTDVSGIEVMYMVQETQEQGYVLEAFLDNADGAKLGEVTIGPGAAPKAPNLASINFSPVRDGKRHALYFKFKATAPDQKVGLGIASFTLK